MDKLWIHYNSVETEINLPMSFETFLQHLTANYNLFGPHIQYIDEDFEMISVTNSLEFEEALKFLANTNKALIIKDPTLKNSSPLLKDQSCGVMKVEETSQTKKEALNDQASEISILYNDMGSDPSYDYLESSVVSTSQIPKYETHSKIIGVEYSDKSTNLIQKTSSKASEVMIETSSLEFSFDLMRSVIQEELHKNEAAVHCFKCTGCGTKPIFQVVYACHECLGLILCQKCEEKSEHEHLLLKFKCQNYNPQLNLIQKLGKLGFKNIEKIRKALQKHGLNYEAIISMLLDIE